MFTKAAGFAMVSFVLVWARQTSGTALDFYADRASWESAVAEAGLLQEDVKFTAANLLLAEEVMSLPGNNTAVGSGDVLTWLSSSTGLTQSFRLGRNGQSDNSWIFNDTEGGKYAFGADSTPYLSPGDLDDAEDDDISLEIFGETGHLMAGAMEIFDNTVEDDELFSFFAGPCTGYSVSDCGESAYQLLSDVTPAPNDFLGFVFNPPEDWPTDVEYHAMVFHEASGGDDVAIRGISVGIKYPIPESSTAPLVALGMIALSSLRTRRA